MSASPPLSPAAADDEQPQAQVNAATFDQMFGSDSDLSDEDDNDNDDSQRPSNARLPFPPRDDAAGGAADDDDDDEEDEDEVYVPATADRGAKIPSFRKKRAGDDGDVDMDDDDDDDDDGEGETRRRQVKEKKKKRRRIELAGEAKRREEREKVGEVDDEDEEQAVLDPDTQRRLALEERIDAIGKKPKTVRRKKKGDDDVDIVDSYHDEVCVRLRDRMINAAEKDKQSNDAKMPATAKLAMLDEVMGVLRNQTLWQSIVDNGVLDAVRAWLEPHYPSKALPAVGIQKAIFEVLPKMDLDTQTLKECRLGPVVLFYTKTKRVTPSINRQADALVQSWSRPIIKRPANFRNRHVDTLDSQPRPASQRDEDGDEDLDAMESMGTQRVKERRRRFDVGKAMEENKGRKGARLYLSKDIQYTVAPESRLQHHVEDMQHVSRIQMDNKKFNRFARQMKAKR